MGGRVEQMGSREREGEAQLTWVLTCFAWSHGRLRVWLGRLGVGEQILEGHCLLASVSLGLNSPSPKLSML